jgi:hypothetical protein
MAFLLGQQGRDWEGGEFILVEQQPRAQSKPPVVIADQGQAIIFTTRYRPVKSSRGYYRVNLRHGAAACTAVHATRGGSFSTTQNDEQSVQSIA